MQAIHKRMPVISPDPENYRQWLDKRLDEDQAFPLLDNLPYDQMEITPVSDWINNPRHYDEMCLESMKKLQF